MSNTPFTSPDGQSETASNGAGGTTEPLDRDGIVSGTAAADFMNTLYTGDPDGDMIDAGDAILPGALPDDDLVRAGGGNDSVIAGFQNDEVYGEDGDDYVDGGEGNDTIDGGVGNDTLWAKEGEDLIFGGLGDDYLKGGLGDDVVYGEDGNDIIYGGDAVPVLEDDGADLLIGGDGNDTFYGGTGDDTVYGGTGDDSMEGGDGSNQLEGEDGRDTLVGGEGSDTAYGGSGDDSMTGNGGDDTLIGGEGGDTASGGDGDDVINTGLGTTDVPLDDFPLPDRGYYSLYPGDLNPTNDLDSVDGGNGNDTITTGDDNDTILAGAGDDVVDGGFDDDEIYGNSGEDTIVGAEGNDSIRGGDDNDLIYGGYGPDVSDVVNIPDDAGDERPDNGLDTLRGGAGDDTIYGMDDADRVYGGQGDDLLDGGIDDDTIAGGVGSDTLIGGHGIDEMFGGADRDSIDGGLGDLADGGSEGDDFDTLNLTGLVPTGGRVELTNVTLDADGNSTSGIAIIRDDADVEIGRVTYTEIEQIVPCFTPGTLIATPKGEVPVERLRQGDKVITRDNGIQEIRWIGEKQIGWAELAANPHLRPVLVRQGSLGNGLPERDMMLSPNHRLLVANDRTALYFDEHEVLVSAKHLVGGQGIQSVQSAGVTYVHFMFDQHEVVLSDGAWTESFQPGDYSLKGVGNAQRSEILELFPDLKTEAGIDAYVAARRTLKRHEASLLIR